MAGFVGVKFILAPPGCGKTTYLAFLNNPFHPVGNSGLKVCDADDILSATHDDASGTNLMAAMDHYLMTPGLGWNKWHRVCFRALISHQARSRDVGPILCGFMVGADFAEVQAGFDDFVGEGDVDSLPGVPKVRPEEVIAVLPREEVLIARGRSRMGLPVDEAHVRNCLRNYRELAERHHGRMRVVNDLGNVASALGTPLAVDSPILYSEPLLRGAAPNTFLVVSHHVDRYIPRVFATEEAAAEYYQSLPSGDSRALFRQGRLTSTSFFFSDEWKSNVISFARTLQPLAHLVSETSLSLVDQSLLAEHGVDFWQRSTREQRQTALRLFPIHKLLCGPRHEYHFTHEEGGRCKMRASVEACSGMSARRCVAFHPETGPTHSTGGHLNVNVIGHDDGQGRFFIQAVNLFDGNRRGCSLVLLFVRGLIRSDDGQGALRSAPALGDVDANIFINGHPCDPGRPRLPDHWVPGDTLCDGSLCASSDRGTDGSVKMRVDVPFSTELIALSHRGRALGAVAAELQRHLPF